MLNELYALAKSLEKCGLNPPTYHPSLKSNQKKSGFVLGIQDDGAVGFVEFCEAEKMREVWRIESSFNGKSFPGFNLASPIWKPTDNVAGSVQKLLKLPKQKTQERLGLLETICQDSTLAYSDAQKKQLQLNLHEFPSRLWTVYSDSTPEFGAFSSLLLRLISSTHAVDAFLRMLTDTSLRLCREGRLGAVLEVEQLLLGRWNKKKEEFTPHTIPVVCEVANRSDYQQVVASPAMASFANTRLQERMPGKDFAESKVNTVESSGIDAFVGTETVLQSTFPSPRLPCLGNTILMSMSSDSPCQTRYGLQDSDTFPVGKNVSEVMQNALLFLTRKEREGRTWHGVPNPNGKQDLLISYLEDKPDSAALLASLFARSDNLAEHEEAQFESITAKVCKALQGEVAEKTDAIIRVIVLSSPDAGRKQLILSDAYQVEEIFYAAEDWQLAAANHPEIKVLLPPAKQQKARLADPFTPFPAAMMTCLNLQWTHEPLCSRNIAGCNLQQICEVFLKRTERSRSASDHLLSLALQRTSNLLLALGHRQHRNSQKDLSAKARITALTAISSFSILLYKQGRQKEIFMNKAPFNIGRLLSFADQLHFIYCRGVRDNQIPPQLLGNALMHTALQRPATALALFAQRILPYQAWARTVQAGENVGLAKYFLKEIATVSQTLSQSSFPEVLTDKDRAEMILGYLASSTSNNQ